MNSKFFIFIFCFLCFSCGVKGPPSYPQGTGIPSLSDKYLGVTPTETPEVTVSATATPAAKNP